MERDYSSIEAMYDTNLKPGGQLPPVAEPVESEEQAGSYEEAANIAPPPVSQNLPDFDNIIDIDSGFVKFEGLRFELDTEEREALKKILVTRIVKNLEKLADEWRTRITSNQ